MGIETILFGVVWSLIAVVLISVLVAYVIRGIGKEVTIPEFPQKQKDPSVEDATDSDYKTANESHTDRSSSDDESNDGYTVDELTSEINASTSEINASFSEINASLKKLAGLVDEYFPELKISEREQKNLEKETMELL